jgi:4-diphosphocytidyl-2-C-methyl-D-erythritol kinase
MLTVKAPAKLNLTLEVLGRRPDGFHEIRSVLETISLCDEITFKESSDISITSPAPGWNASESLIARTVDLIRETTGTKRGVEINVKKNIPLVSGLGGDSSDAAATLKGLNQLWGLGLPQETLVEMARKLGSDVAFFLYGGTALAEGRGEIITPLAPLPHHWVVLAMPDMPRLPGKTKRMYENLGINHHTDGSITQKLVGTLASGKEFNNLLLFNTFENLAFVRPSETWLARSHMVKMGAGRVHLAGSGPALYALMGEREKAEDLYHRLIGQQLSPHLVETLPQVE